MVYVRLFALYFGIILIAYYPTNNSLWMIWVGTGLIGLYVGLEEKKYNGIS